MVLTKALFGTGVGLVVGAFLALTKGYASFRMDVLNHECACQDDEKH
jgi:hypothetical protein